MGRRFRFGDLAGNEMACVGRIEVTVRTRRSLGKDE
jgi:hypothetical protein